MSRYSQFISRRLFLLVVTLCPMLFGVWLLAGAHHQELYWQSWHKLSQIFAPTSKLSLVIAPPAYANLPTLTLADPTHNIQQGMPVHVPAGSTLAVVANGNSATHIFLNDAWQNLPAGEGALTTAYQKGQHLAVRQGVLLIGYWPVISAQNAPPQVQLLDAPEILSNRQVRLRVAVADDVGLKELKLQLANSANPAEPFDELTLRPLARDATHGQLIADLGDQASAGTSLRLTLVATDIHNHVARSNSVDVTLPPRQFTQAMASKLVDLRQQLLNEPNLRQVTANEMALLARSPEVYGNNETIMLALRTGAVRLILDPGEASIAAVSQLLWQAASRLENGRFAGRAQASWTN